MPFTFECCRALDQVSGIKGDRIASMTGVWVQGQKIAAIGVRAKSWVTYHGLALNVAMDLEPFKAITPCGIIGRCTTSVQLASNNDNMTAAIMMLEYATALLDALSEVFNVDLIHAGSNASRDWCLRS